MRIKFNKVIGLVAVTLGVALLGLNGTAAHANIEPGSGSPVVTTTPNGFLYTYNIFVSADQIVNPGDFFTIYDFAGFTNFYSITGAPGNATYTMSQANTSGAVFGAGGQLNPNDNAGITNLTFTLNPGSTPIAGVPGSGSNPGSSVFMGAFAIESTLGPGNTLLSFIGAGTKRDLGVQNGNLTSVLGPGVVPEPGEYAFAAFAGSSVLGLVIRARRRNAKAAL